MEFPGGEAAQIDTERTRFGSQIGDREGFIGGRNQTAGGFFGGADQTRPGGERGGPMVKVCGNAGITAAVAKLNLQTIPYYIIMEQGRRLAESRGWRRNHRGRRRVCPGGHAVMNSLRTSDTTTASKVGRRKSRRQALTIEAGMMRSRVLAATLRWRAAAGNAVDGAVLQLLQFHLHSFIALFLFLPCCTDKIVTRLALSIRYIGVCSLYYAYALKICS